MKQDAAPSVKHIKHEQAEKFIYEVLVHLSCREDVAESVARGLVETSIRGVDSHGIRLFPHYVRALKGGRINPRPKYSFEKKMPSCGCMDADHTYGIAAGVEAMKKAMEMAGETGMGAVALYNSSHNAASSIYGLMPAREDMIGLCFTHASPLMKSHGGVRPFFGANPVCFTAPMEGEDPMCLDMATTQLTWNKVKEYKEHGKDLPVGLVFDKEGQPTLDPGLAVMLEGIGGYKGFGLSIMIDVLCALLTGMPAGDKISNMYGNPIGEKRYLGQFFMAMRVDGFEDIKKFKKRLRELAEDVRNEPAEKPDSPVQFPGDPEKRAATERRGSGIPVHEHLAGELSEISRETGASLW